MKQVIPVAGAALLCESVQRVATSFWPFTCEYGPAAGRGTQEVHANTLLSEGVTLSPSASR